MGSGPETQNGARLVQLHRKAELQSALAQAAAISKSQAVIEFNLDGTIITANPNFLAAVGYSLEEIKGKHHSIFVEQAVRDSSAYREFWAKLNRGEFEAAQYKRVGKGGRKYGSRPPTIRSSTPGASRSR